MTKLTTVSLFLLAAGIFTSVSILSLHQMLFAIPLIYYSWVAVQKKELKLPTSSWFLIAFILIALVSLFINYGILPKPSKNFGRLRYFLFGAAGILVLKAWIKEASDRTKTLICNLFLTTVILAGVFSAYSFFMALREDGRARGFTDTLRYGYGSSMMLITLLSALLQREKIKAWFNLKLGLAAFIIGFIGMYFTYNRGSLLAFMCALPFALYFYKRKIGLTLGGLALLGVLALVGNYLLGTADYNSRFLVNKNNPSDHIRRSQWKAALIAINEKPVLGWGFSNFHSQLERIKNQNDLDAKFYKDAHSHNLFLEVASGTGLIGLMFFIGWVLTWAWETFRTGGVVRALVLPFGVAWVVGSQFEMTLDANNASMIFFMYAMSSALLENSLPSQAPQQ
jgi:O-antigen ligase